MNALVKIFKLQATLIILTGRSFDGGHLLFDAL